MKGNEEILTLLNQLLTNELTAINQYFIHAKLCEHWGYKKLAGKVRHESIDEMKHADELIERILYLDGLPNVQRLFPIRVGESVAEIFAADGQLEREAIPRLNDAIALCVAEGDNGTRALLEEILVSEEEHLDWIETQERLIAQLGDVAYLAEQLRGD